jgi:hypothetical protein
MTFAINWDVANDPAYEAATPQQVYDWGFRGVRIKSFESTEPRVQTLFDANLEIMSVVTWESEGYVSPLATWLQVHNEMTSGGAPMSPDQYVYEYLTYKSVFGSVYNYAFGGLALGGSRDIEWLSNVLLKLDPRTHPDAIALHLYTLTPQDAQAYCDRVWNAFRIPVICTEWWRAAEQGHHPFQCMLNGQGLDGQGPRAQTWNSFFCLSDHMTFNTEGTHLGLLGLDDQPKPEFYSLLSAPEDCKT